MSSRLEHPATRQHERAGQTENTVELLTRRAHRQLADVGLEFSPSKVSRIIRAYLRTARAVTVADFDAWFMPHTDPTGEQAVRNIMAGGNK
jgi:hypothetical protein